MLRRIVTATAILLWCQSTLFAQVRTEPVENRSRIHLVSQTDEPIFLDQHAANGGGLATTPAKPPLPSLSQHRKSTDDADVAPTAKNQLAGPAVTVTSSLAVVLGLFALMIWLTRRFSGRSLGQTALPGEVLQSLGTTTLDARTKINLLRCGGRVIVVAQTATGVFPISEFTSPEEVRQLIAACQPGSRQSFAQTLQAFEQEPTPRGFAGSDGSPTDVAVDRRKRGRLFATA